MVEEDEGMLIIRLPGFDIPLIVRKSDGGFGYDSTDMAAVEYRLQTLQRDWIIAVTDAGQHIYYPLPPSMFYCNPKSFTAHSLALINQLLYPLLLGQANHFHMVFFPYPLLPIY